MLDNIRLDMAKKAAAKQEQPFIEKTIASVDEIAHQWGGTLPLETVISIIRRLKTGQFKFQAPKELAVDEKPEEKISLGADFFLSDFSFLYKIEDLICQRCAWYIKNGKEYQQPNYEAIFASLAQVKLDLAGKMPGTEFMVWEEYIKKLRPLLLPPEMVNEKSEEEVADALRQLLLGQADSAQKEKIDSLSADEIAIMQLMLAKHLYLSKSIFFHWLRLERHKLNPHSSKPYKGEYQIPDYNQFWGDEWEGQPQPWKPDTDESHGLILGDAFKFYSDPHDWAEFEAARKKPEGLQGKEKDDAYEKIEKLHQNLLLKFLALFSPKRAKLKAQGYIEGAKPSEISFMQLKDMVESRRFHTSEARAFLGKVEVQSIRIFKSNQQEKEEKPVKNIAEVEKINPKRRKSLHKLILAMAVDKFRYNPEATKNSSTQNIEDALSRHGLSIDKNTIRDILDEAYADLKGEIIIDRPQNGNQ